MTLVQTPYYTRPVEANYYMYTSFPKFGRFAPEAELICEVFHKTDSEIAYLFARRMVHKMFNGPISLSGWIDNEQVRSICWGIFSSEKRLRIASDLVDERFVEFLDRFEIAQIELSKACCVDFDDKEGQAKVLAAAEDFLAENGWIRKDDEWRGPYYEKA